MGLNVWWEKRSQTFWQSGCMQGGTRLRDSKGTSLPFLWHNPPPSDRLGHTSKHVMELNKNGTSCKPNRDHVPGLRRNQRNESGGKGMWGSGGLTRSVMDFSECTGTILNRTEQNNKGCMFGVA